jgi:hypothetical protein
MVDKLNIYLLHRYFQHNQSLNINKNMMYTTAQCAHGVNQTILMLLLSKSQNELKKNIFYSIK